MRLIHRSRNQRRGRAPRIEISQAEITADLNYPASQGSAQRLRASEVRRGGGR